MVSWHTLTRIQHVVSSGAAVRRYSTSTGWTPATRSSVRPLWPRRRSVQHDALADLLNRLPAYLVPPTIFVGLALVLWSVKCVNMIVFQNKILYIPYLPPGSRSENLGDYGRDAPASVLWREHDIRSEDGTKLAVATAHVDVETDLQAAQGKSTGSKRPILLLHFHGNGSSIPPRLPVLSGVLVALAAELGQAPALAVLSYRGYWHSSGRPSQLGIELDARAFLDWAVTQHPDHDLVLWGQSIGAGVAAGLLAHLLTGRGVGIHVRSCVVGAVLETPFVSVRRMLAVLYPQSWLPYKHLWPFLLSTWDSEAALRRIARSGVACPPVLMLVAAEDEIVPPGESRRLLELGTELGLPVSRKFVAGALHSDVMLRTAGRKELTAFIAGLPAAVVVGRVVTPS